MGLTQKYRISHKGLIDGEHSFDFKVDDALFELYDRIDIKSGDCDVKIALLRSETMLNISVNISGQVVVECDRCLDDCSLPVEYNGDLIVKFSDNEEEYDGDIMWVPSSESYIDLAQYIYESIVLALPYRRVHDEGGCNSDITNYFKTISAEELEAMDVSANQEQSGEWNKLAELKERMEQKDTTEQKDK